LSKSVVWNLTENGKTGDKKSPCARYSNWKDAMALSSGEGNGIQGLQFLAVNFHGEALHDGIHREDDTEAVPLSHHNARHPGKGAGSNASPLPHLQ
jgi:hypothetical protein